MVAEAVVINMPCPDVDNLYASVLKRASADPSLPFAHRQWGPPRVRNPSSLRPLPLRSPLQHAVDGCEIHFAPRNDTVFETLVDWYVTGESSETRVS